MLEFDASKVVAKIYYSLCLKVNTTLGYVIEIRRLDHK